MLQNCLTLTYNSIFIRQFRLLAHVAVVRCLYSATLCWPLAISHRSPVPKLSKSTQTVIIQHPVKISRRVFSNDSHLLRATLRSVQTVRPNTHDKFRVPYTTIYFAGSAPIARLATAESEKERKRRFQMGRINVPHLWIAASSPHCC